MKFEELQGKRVVFSGDCVPLSVRTKAWRAGALICVTVDKDTDVVISTNIKTCAAHPLRKAEADIVTLRSALIGLIGAETEAELRQIEQAIRAIPVPDSDRAVSINAINALIATMPCR